MKAKSNKPKSSEAPSAKAQPAAPATLLKTKKYNEPPFHAPTALRHLARVDKRLALVIKAVGAFEIEIDLRESPFHALLRSIIYQQLSGKAAAAIHQRVAALFPHRRTLRPEEILRTPDEKFRGAGMSRAKVLAIKDLSEKTLSGVVPTRREINKLTNEEIIERLIQVRGIGPWTVEMILIFCFGRMDVLSVTDYGVRKGFARAYKKRDLPKPKELARFGLRWAPYRSVANWYLWRVLELDPKKFILK